MLPLRHGALGRAATTSAAVGLGGLAACLYLAGVLGNPGALILVYMTQLPLFIAGLWLGPGAAAFAGLTGTTVLFGASDASGAALFAVLNAVPVAVLVRQALLARRAEDSVAWYPPGLLTGWLTAFALAGFAAALLVFDGVHGLHASLRTVAAEALDRLAGGQLPNRDAIADSVALIIPGILAASWMFMAIANAVLAQGVLARFRINWRPTLDIAELSLPLWVAIALGIAAGATLFGGAPRFVGINVMIALCVPFCLAGLAVLHAAVRRLPNPSLVLVGFYIAAALFGWPLLLIAVVGLFENWLGLRQRLASHGVRSDG